MYVCKRAESTRSHTGTNTDRSHTAHGTRTGKDERRHFFKKLLTYHTYVGVKQVTQETRAREKQKKKRQTLAAHPSRACVVIGYAHVEPKAGGTKSTHRPTIFLAFLPLKTFRLLDVPGPQYSGIAPHPPKPRAVGPVVDHVLSRQALITRPKIFMWYVN